MNKRWSTTLIASLFLFLLNWVVWAYNLVVEKQWHTTPVGASLSALVEDGHAELADVMAWSIAIFLVILTLRIYSYLLLLEHDEVFQKALFDNNSPWILRIEFVVRCSAVVAVNFIYYSANLRYADFKTTLVVTALLVFAWDLCMIRRLVMLESLRTVFQRDGLFTLCALAYLFVGSNSSQDLLVLIVIAALGSGIFYMEITHLYWDVWIRIWRSRSLA